MIQNISNAVKNFGCSTLPTNVWILSHVFWETVFVTGHVVLFGWFLLTVCGTLKGHLLGLQLTVTVVVVFIFIFLASAFLQIQALEAKAKEITLIISWRWSHFGCNCKLTGVNLFCQNLHPFLSVSHKIPSFIIVYQMVNGTARI